VHFSTISITASVVLAVVLSVVLAVITAITITFMSRVPVVPVAIIMAAMWHGITAAQADCQHTQNQY
jgi:hypothetical protein